MNGAGNRLPAPDAVPALASAVAAAAPAPMSVVEVATAASMQPPALGAIDKCVEDVCAAVRAALTSPSPNKFTEAARLCTIGHQLAKARAATVDEFEGLLGVAQPAANAPGVIAFNNGGAVLNQGN